MLQQLKSEPAGTLEELFERMVGIAFSFSLS
jgi:hypothetical protein